MRWLFKNDSLSINNLAPVVLKMLKILMMFKKVTIYR